jgi:hypothetical protein
MTDFSKTLFHCSEVKNIMSNGVGKPKYKKMDDIKARLNELQEKYNACISKETKKAH